MNYLYVVNRERLFAELEALSEEEIESSLDAGAWDDDKRQLVEHYLDQMKLTRMQLEAAASAKGAAIEAATYARRSISIARTALIVAAGAILAAMASAFVALLALRNSIL
jgi:hypothetical protein